jgi:hypothetical protein
MFARAAALSQQHLSQHFEPQQFDYAKFVYA